MEKDPKIEEAVRKVLEEHPFERREDDPAETQRLGLIFHSGLIKITLTLLLIILAAVLAKVFPDIANWIVDLGGLWGPLFLTIPMIVIIKFWNRSTALVCPRCKNRTLEGDSGSRYSDTHECSHCGMRFDTGEPHADA